jgi:hypothetical protein
MEHKDSVPCSQDPTSAYKILVEESEGRRPLGRPRRRCEGNIKMDLRIIGLEVVDWIHLAQHRHWWQALVNMVTFGFHKKWGISWLA